ncbi:bcl-2-interacting killer isoform X1 [Conger conger]|nr:bcl-2-interacting killer isoform X1 [Conger conger]
MRTTLHQAGPGTSADLELRVAQKIGWQLAEIGDELNRHYLNKPPNPWLLPLLGAGHAHRLARNRIYRRLFGAQQMQRRRPGEIWAWLITHFRRHVVRAECRGSWVSAGLGHPYSWAAGMFTAVLLATAVAWISF